MADYLEAYADHHGLPVETGVRVDRLRDTRAMKIYFAGPLFTAPERTWNAEVTAALRAAGHEVFLPQEQEPGKDGPGIFVTDVSGIDWADGLVAIMDGPDPESGTSWEVGYAFGRRKPIVLVRTDSPVLAGNAGDYNPMLTQAATIRIDLPVGSTTEVIAAILDALPRIEAAQATGSVEAAAAKLSTMSTAKPPTGTSDPVDRCRT
jgi:nucleoside 2-deoxyribosyltransferase